jgi:flagellin-like protein
MNYKQFMKNCKAISPIFATLILIAIAVIAGVVVYMFTSGTLATMTNGGTAAQEKAAVQGLSVNANGTAFTVYAQSTANAIVNIKSEIFKDASGTTIGVANVASTLSADGSLIKITGTVTFSPSQTIGVPITVTLVGENGGSFVSASVPAI